VPDDRFFHKRAGHSDKVNQLTDFEELVWRYYVLSSDDFGVMRFSPAQIRTDHERAEKRPEKAIQKALETIRGVGLVHTFEHQGRVYCYSRNWQRYQKVDYPRETILPCPPAAELVECEETTRYLFAAHPGGKEGRNKRRAFTEQSPNDSAAIQEPASERFLLTRAGAKAKAQAKAEEQGSGQGCEEAVEPKTTSERAGEFCEWYADTHLRLVGVGYIGNPRKDYEAVLRLVSTFADAELRDGALFWFGQNDDFAKNGTRTISKFASRASDCVLQARRVAS
jgi:hypothetical protein